MFLHVVTSKLVYQLHQEQQDECKKYCVRIESKKTDGGFVKRIGFISGPCLSAASTDVYASKITNSIPNAHVSIKLKKHMTFERGVRSKAMVVYALEELADTLNKDIMN